MFEINQICPQHSLLGIKHAGDGNHFSVRIAVVFLDMLTKDTQYNIFCKHRAMKGLFFLKSHWYITIGYFYVWIDLPLVGLALRKLTNAQHNH